MKRKTIFKMMIALFVAATFVLGPLAVSAAEKKQITRKMLLAGRVANSWYALSQGLANFVNKQSDWLRLEVVVTPGVSAGAEMAIKDYDKYIFLSPYYGFKLNPTLKKMNYYDKDLIIGFCTGNTWVWATYDKNIRTAQDLIGKTVFIGRPGGARHVFEASVLEALGVKDKVKLLAGQYGGGRNALRDGLADVAVFKINYILPAGFKKGPFIEELEARKPVYYINLMPPDLQLKLDMIPVKIHAGALDPKTQKEEVYASIDPIFWCADERMDEAVVREVTRILYKNVDELSNWHAEGGGITKESVCTYIIGPQRMHPIAEKYYEEQGAKIKPLSDILP